MIPDDGYVHVPLQFGFPFYGQVFTDSWMFDNGVVGFFDPLAGGTGGQNWGSQPLDQVGSQFNYIIAPLWTDLISYSGVHRVEGTSQYQRYTWENVSPFSRPDLLNTFEVEIRPDGFIGVDYLMINFDQTNWLNSISIGTVGDTSQQEFEQISFITQFPTTHIDSWAVNNADPCFFDPLSDPSCPGYFDIQCSIDPLYDTSCSGYAEEFYNFQCFLDPLYDFGCFGFEEAFYDQQCSLDPLYDSGCVGYEEAFFDQQCSLDPLYDSGCAGFEQAFFEQQCSLDSLYDQSCTGYEQAFFEQQCSLNPLYDQSCAGFEQAFFDQQCSLNPLYDQSCAGHELAFLNQQCSLNPLYDSDCTGYEQAFFDQQCSLNPLYDSGCTGYEQAFFDQQVKDSCSANPNNPVCGDSVPETVVLVAEDPTEIQIVSDPVVQRVISATATTRREEAVEEEVEEEVTQEEARERKIAQIRNSVGEKSPEELEQEALINEIANVPGFEVYQSSTLQDAPFYAPKEIYSNQIPVDNRNAMRLLRGSNDVRYREMIDQQYR